jgi:hypothetical protein
MPRDITVTFDDGSTHVYRNAPDDVTPDAVEARARKDFGKAVRALDGGRGRAAPATPPGQIPGQAPDTPGPAALPPVEQVPLGRRAVQMVRPTVEALGSVGGAALGGGVGMLGTPAGAGVGAVVGAGLGYGAAKTGLDYLEQQLGYQQAPKTVGEALSRGVEDVAQGAAMELLGRKVIAPVMSKGAETIARVRNLKESTYLKALEGKGDDILELLRGAPARTPGAAPTAGEVAAPVAAPAAAPQGLASRVKEGIYRKALEAQGYFKPLETAVDNALTPVQGAVSRTPGAAPTAGEVAAPAGSVRFTALQEQAKKVPEVASDYALQQAQTTAAQTAQQSRAQARFDQAAARVQQRVNSAMAPLKPEDVGVALKTAADAKREAIKKTVIAPAYEAAFQAAGDVKIPLDDVITQAENILGRKLSTFDASTAPETVRKLMALQPPAPAAATVGAGKISGRIKAAPATPAPAEVTLRDLDDIRKAINADIAAGKVSTDPAAATRLRNLGQIHGAIDDAVAKSGIPDDAKALYGEALQKYREQYIPRFKTGVNNDLFRTTGANEAKIKPEDVITKYFQPKGVSEARNFVSLFGGDPKAMQVARSGIEELYAREAGKFTPEAHAAFLKKYADPIKVMDDAGMNLTQRLDVVGRNVARLDAIQKIAEKANVKLAPPLPPGATADAVERRLQALTKGLSPKQLTDVNAVRADLLRSGEYERLAKASSSAGMDIGELGTQAGKEVGVPLPAYLNVFVTTFNNVVKRLTRQMDQKLAIEIAREMTDPALAAKSIEKALRTGDTTKLAGARAAARARAATTGIGVLSGLESGRYNALSPEESTNALAP